MCVCVGGLVDGGVCTILYQHGACTYRFIRTDNFWNVISDYSDEDTTLPMPHYVLNEEDVSTETLVSIQVPNGTSSASSLKMEVKNAEEPDGTVGENSFEEKDGCYTVCNMNNGVLVKEDGTLQGKNGVLEALNDSKVYLLDISEEVVVRNCRNLLAYIGPAQGGFEAVECVGCNFTVACSSFRAE